MRGKTAKKLRKIARLKYPKLDEADKRQFKNYVKRIKRRYLSLPRNVRAEMMAE